MTTAPNPGTARCMISNLSVLPQITALNSKKQTTKLQNKYRNIFPNDSFISHVLTKGYNLIRKVGTRWLPNPYHCIYVNDLNTTE